MKFSIVTLFPEVFSSVLSTSILKRAQDKGLVEYSVVDLRKYGIGTHQTVDDRPYGGGAGMVFKPDVLADAINSIQDSNKKVVLMSAGGQKFTHKKAVEYSSLQHIVIICGHYEGVDQRFIENYVDEEISIGDFVLTGGEIPAMAVVDAVTRQIPKVLEKEEAVQEESFSEGLLEYPQYTRPEVFENKKVPDILLSGNHQEIAKWRREQSIKKTQEVRPDLLD